MRASSINHYLAATFIIFIMINFPLAITDPVYVPKQKLSAFEKWCLTIIKDPRDLPFMHLLLQIHLIVLPLALLLFSPLLSGGWWWLVAVPYFYISQFYFKGSFGLMLHCFCHRKIWQKHTQWIQKYILWFLCPFFGHLGEGYFSHHIGMHHIEGNMPDDTSSTMFYQRDSLRSFIAYWLNFVFRGVAQTVNYFVRRKMPRFYWPLSWNEVLFIVLAIALCFVHLKAALVVFIIPLMFARLVMMLGNWTQHAFVDVEHPEDGLTNSVICINTAYNHKCWNDGYHAFHHIRQAAHYTEYPGMMQSHQEEMASKKTLVFNGIHYLHIFFFLMTKRYDKLANALVNINGTFANEEDAIALMKKRTQKFDVQQLNNK